MNSFENFQGVRDQSWGHISYAQHGEDYILLNIFHRIGIKTPSYLDIGAHHPINISNTALLYSRGCRGVNVEANPDLFGDFVKLRPDDINLNVGVTSSSGGEMPFYRLDKSSGRNSFDKSVVEQFISERPEFSITSVISVKTDTINNIVMKHCQGQYPDFISMDVEGLELDILKSADFSRSRPNVLCIETGANKEMITKLLDARGFGACFRTVSNVFYARKEFLAQILS